MKESFSVQRGAWPSCQAARLSLGLDQVAQVFGVPWNQLPFTLGLSAGKYNHPGVAVTGAEDLAFFWLTSGAPGQVGLPACFTSYWYRTQANRGHIHLFLHTAESFLRIPRS